MIIHDVEQRSAAWDALRLGKPTASNFDKILTPGGKLSEQWKRYAYHLIAERLLGRPVGTYTSPAMERGAIVESEARAWYELYNNIDVRRVGFIETDDHRIGCSPDFLVGEEGLGEIKCPEPAAMVEYLLTGELDKRYKPQIQGQLWVSERKWVDIIAWHDELPRCVIRVERDEEYIEKLGREVLSTCAEIDRVIGMINDLQHEKD